MPTGRTERGLRELFRDESMGLESGLPDGSSCNIFLCLSLDQEGGTVADPPDLMPLYIGHIMLV